MTDETTAIGDAFEEATAAAQRAFAEREDESLPEDERESLREATDRLASDASSASVAELLDAAGFEDVPDDVSAVDLPAVIRDADAAAIVELRRLLRLADLGESWSDLSDEERIGRLESVVGDDEEDDGGFAQLKEYLDKFGHLGGEEGGDEVATESTDDADDDETDEGDEESDDADEGILDSLTSDDEDRGDGEGDDEGLVESLTDDEDESADDGADDGDEDDELVELEDHVARLRAMFSDDEDDDGLLGDDDEDDEDDGLLDDEDDGLLDDEDDGLLDDEDEDDDTDGRTRSAAGSSRFSTVPSSRSDMGSSTGFSTVRGKE